MDARAEFSLFSTLRQMTEGKLVIIVPHRFATVRSADRIVVIDEGKIAETGMHDELMKLDSIYAGLYRVQQDALNG
jgi:ABC-type multidrug transport system fused ATPase/permease subunit